MIVLPNGFPVELHSLVTLVADGDNSREFDEEMCRTIMHYVGTYGNNIGNADILQCVKANRLFSASTIDEFEAMVEDYQVLTTMSLSEWTTYMERINKIRNIVG